MAVDHPQLHVAASEYPYVVTEEPAVVLVDGREERVSRRVMANRANSRKSTGPTSVEGKAASSRNALRHGAYATAMVLPDEDPQELAELQEGLLAELRPENGLQREVVARIAGAVWRLRRLGHVTAEVADDARHIARQDDIRQQQRLRALRRSGQADKARAEDDGQGIRPWLTGIDCLTDEFERQDPQKPLMALMAAEERTERGLLAAVRLLLRLQTKPRKRKGDADDGAASAPANALLCETKPIVPAEP